MAVVAQRALSRFRLYRRDRLGLFVLLFIVVVISALLFPLHESLRRILEIVRDWERRPNGKNEHFFSWVDLIAHYNDNQLLRQSDEEFDLLRSRLRYGAFSGE